MASPSHLALERKERAELSRGPQVSLEVLPFAAALIGASGSVEAYNREWASARTEFLELPVVREGVRAILASESKRVTEQIGERGNRCRVVITPNPTTSGTGALVVLQRMELPPQPDKMPESEKMATFGRLLGGVVHDFANLLTMISGYSEILLNRLGDHHRLRDELEEIRKAANRGARLTGQLLGFTRGRTAEPSLLDLNEIVTGILRMLHPIIGEHLNLETALAPDLGKVLADPGQIEQVLMNLVLNARDAMPRGGKIVVETRNFEVGEPGPMGQGASPAGQGAGAASQIIKANGVSAGRYVMLSVSDTGHGIDPGIMDRLWEPLFTTKPEGKGTGLGLNTVRKVVQESGGSVWVRSVVGQGTTFFVCLPQAQAPVWERPSSVDPLNLLRPLPLSTQAGSETVLIVEDESGVRRLLRYVLEGRGYQVLEAANGEDALRVYQQAGQIDLVLTDIIMPQMGGRELADRLCNLDPNVRIVFMSGYTDDVLVRTGELGKGMSFLQKPLRPDTLATKVREALDSPSRPFSPR